MSKIMGIEGLLKKVALNSWDLRAMSLNPVNSRQL